MSPLIFAHNYAHFDPESKGPGILICEAFVCHLITPYFLYSWSTVLTCCQFKRADFVIPSATNIERISAPFTTRSLEVWMLVHRYTTTRHDLEGGHVVIPSNLVHTVLRVVIVLPFVPTIFIQSHPASYEKKIASIRICFMDERPS